MIGRKSSAFTTRTAELQEPGAKLEIVHGRSVASKSLEAIELASKKAGKAAASKNVGKTMTTKRTSKEESEDVGNTLPIKVYIYLQLKSMVNIPKRDGDIELKLQIDNEVIQRLDKECTSCRLMKMDEMECNVTFSFPVYQDSVESLNEVSNNPILITLYEHVVHSSASDEEEEALEEDIVIAQGYIDLLGYFQKKRFSTFVDTFIYPVDKIDQVNCGTTKATWQIYTLLPLLKNLEYSNIIFLNFESLYNCTEDLMDDAEDLKADLVFRELNPSDRGKGNIIEICSFSGFTKDIIKEQNPNFTWESAKAAEEYASGTFGFQTDNKVNIYRLFKRLLRPEGKQLDFKDINIEKNEALVCNSTQRFVLTEELRILLEDVFSFRQYALMVRIFRKGAPEEILLEGYLEPSVLLYPFVNAVRFAVVLQPPTKSSQGNVKKAKPKKDSLASGDSAQKHIFAIISVCLLTPITEETQTLANYSQAIPREKYSYCHRKRSNPTMAPIAILKERAYDSFDDWVAEVVDHIVKNNIREIDDAKNFFCCQSQNAGNKILALIALDFNQRFPTKNNIEFSNLMATVYKELENRVYKTIEACGFKDLRDCRITDKLVQDYIIKLMNFMKLANESGDDTLSGIILKELKDNYSKNIDFNHYMFLNDVENGSFEDAKEYIAKPPKDRKLKDEYFIRILDIYIQYMENLQHEEVFNEAFERLIGGLLEFLKYYRRDFDGWILLYCLYKSSEYLPGMEFARWHYEDLSCTSRRLIEEMPCSRSQFYFDYDIDFVSPKGIEFYNTVCIFQWIGAYKFAEIVFNEIAKECSEIERYLQKTTLEVLLKEVNTNSKIREFADTTGALEASLNHVNGHLLYASSRQDQAMNYYKNIIQLVDDSDEIKQYSLGLKRYANQMMSEDKYAEALNALFALDKCKSTMSVSITMGKAFYKLCNYTEALECFKKSTEHNLFIPDVWGYLALIHLKMGDNFKALECWKYAKHLPNMAISKEILNELNNIDIDDVDLYVDRPF